MAVLLLSYVSRPVRADELDGKGMFAAFQYENYRVAFSSYQFAKEFQPRQSIWKVQLKDDEFWMIFQVSAFERKGAYNRLPWRNLASVVTADNRSLPAVAPWFNDEATFFYERKDFPLGFIVRKSDFPLRMTFAGSSVSMDIRCPDKVEPLVNAPLAPERTEISYLSAPGFNHSENSPALVWFNNFINEYGNNVISRKETAARTNIDSFTEQEYEGLITAVEVNAYEASIARQALALTLLPYLRDNPASNRFAALRKKVFSRDFMLRMGPEYVVFLPEALRKDREFMGKLIECNGEVLRYADESIKNDPETVLKTWPEYAVYASSALRENREFMLKMHAPIGALSGKLRDDKDMVLACYTGDYALCAVSERLRDDEDVVRKIVYARSNELKEASPRLRDDKDFLTRQLKIPHTYGFALEDVSERLRDDREFVLQMVALNGDNLKAASDRLKDDEEVVRLAVTEKTPWAKKYASARIRRGNKPLSNDSVILSAKDRPEIRKIKGEYTITLPSAMIQALRQYDENFVIFRSSDYAPDILKYINCSKDHILSAVIGDFNGDKITDAVIHGHNETEALVLGIVSSGKKYTVEVLHSYPWQKYDDNKDARQLDDQSKYEWTYLTYIPPRRVEGFEGDILDLKTDAVELEYFGQASVLYYYDHGFQEFTTGD
jgi:hypothetical protein